MDLSPLAPSPPPEAPPLAEECHVWVHKEPWPTGRSERRTLLPRLLRLYAPDGSVAVDRTCPRCGLQHGKPRLVEANGQESALRVSAAHAPGVSVFALSAGADIGIDVEVVRDDFDWTPLLGTVFSPAERRETEGQATERAGRQRRYYERWVAKEAVMKAIGVGVDGPMNEVDTTGSVVEWRGYTVVPLCLDPPIVGALACGRPHRHVRLYPLSSHPVTAR